MTDWYWCETCQDVKQRGYDTVHELLYPSECWQFHCKKCGSEVSRHETYDCPIHGTAAPDGYGNCAKC